MSQSAIMSGYLLPHPPIIVPGVGDASEAQKTVNAMLRVGEDIARLKPDTLLVLSPHAPMFSDFVFMYGGDVLSGSLARFGCRDRISFEQDTRLLAELERECASHCIDGGLLSGAAMKQHGISGELDHGAFVPLYFARKFFDAFQLVVLSPSAMDMKRVYALGKCIAQAAASADRRVVIIASGDMSHKVNSRSPYGACPEGKAFDDALCAALRAGDIPQLLSIDAAMREKAAECGYRSLVALCGALEDAAPRIEVLSYEAPYGIGYCVARFLPEQG